MMNEQGFQEKRGVVEQGRTPPETDEKQASEDALEDHLTKRAEDVVAGGITRHSIPKAIKATRQS